MKTDFDKFVDAFIEHVVKVTGITREELLKKWSADGAVAKPSPVIEVGDVVNPGCCDEEECQIVKIVNGQACVFDISPDETCACETSIDNATLIRKGPKVHTFKGIKIYKGPEVPFINFSKGDNYWLDEGKKYNVTVTEDTP